MGIALGLVTAYQMLQTDWMGDLLPFTVLGLALVLLLLTPVVAALALPPFRRRRHKIQPAVSLRSAD